MLSSAGLREVLCRCEEAGIQCFGQLRECVCRVCDEVVGTAGPFLGEIVTRCVLRRRRCSEQLAVMTVITWAHLAVSLYAHARAGGLIESRACA